MSTASPTTESLPAREISTPLPTAPAPPLAEFAPIEPAPVVDGMPLYRLSAEQYRLMGEHGVIDDKAPVMLINGLLVDKMGKHLRHVNTINRLERLLSRAIPEGWLISIQNPVALTGSPSEPEPDLAVIRGILSDFDDRLAGPSEISLLIEVSQSTLRADETTMKAIYAAAGFPICWIVNLIARRIQVYTDPTGPDPSPDYRRRQDYGPEDSVPLFLDGREITRLAVADILPSK